MAEMMPGMAPMKGKGKKKMRDMKAKMKAFKAKNKKLSAEMKKSATAVAELTKKLELAGATSDVGKRLEAVAKLSPEHRTWLFHEANDLPLEKRVEFVDAAVEKRDELVKEQPIEKMEERLLAALPLGMREVYKASKSALEIANSAQDVTITADITKRAETLGLPVALVPHMVAVHKAAPDALKEIERVFKALGSQTRTELIFKEFGSSHGAGDDADSAVAQVSKRIDAMMAGANPPRTRNVALNKIASSPDEADQTLWRLYKTEMDNGKTVVAA